jgi:hypothetical protein
MTTRKIYKKTNEENNQAFVTRVVNAEDRPMRPQDILDVCFVVGFRKNKGQVHSHLADSFRSNLITKWRCPELKRVVYAPLTHQAPAVAPPLVIKHSKGVMNNYDPAKLQAALDDEFGDERLSSRSYPNLLTTLANFHQVTVKEVQKAISDVISDITMNHNDDKTNTLITSLKEICAEAFE